MIMLCILSYLSFNIVKIFDLLIDLVILIFYGLVPLFSGFGTAIFVWHLNKVTYTYFT